MVKVRPFKAIRPVRDKANLVASRSYLTYSEETIKEKLDNNPYTFLHIINPDYNNKYKSLGIHKFQLIKKKLNQFINDGILKKDNIASYYIYQKQNQLNTFTGIIGASSVKDYLDNKIKKHEQTLTKREKIFCEYLKTTNFNADPVLLSHEPNKNIKEILKKYTNTRAEYEFTTTNKSLHKLWIVDKLKDINIITNAFNKIDNIYIADGHHRCASSALLSKNINSVLSSYFMCYLIEEDQLNILNFNRLVKHLNGFTVDQFIKKIKKKHSIFHKKQSIYSPTLKNEISMYIDGKWYSIVTSKKRYTSTSESLDPSILSKDILNPILNIIDERTDKNISFIDGTIPLSTLKEKVDSGEYRVAFILKPIHIDLIKKVADKNEIMPPKSTYVEPKLRSGLTIYSIK
ncbi:MAG: hypothetical protein CMD14_05315 [Flavobacteriales bacterium]|nr:hypothetical protein [Flavobacteriales bacterium]|tara:strand:+ start:41759 stop:42967 length:1209 start_codon:yes stop_codon:yes gene_type:complete